MNYKELCTIIIKPWISVKEIMTIANCGRNSAIKLRKKIEEEIIKSGNFLPKSSPIVVPTKKVLESLGLDKTYIFDMANKEKRLDVGDDYYASL